MGRTQAATQLQPTSLTGPLPRRQQSWQVALDAATVAAMPQSGLERLAACSGPEGGACLLATRADLRSTLTDAEFVSYSRVRFVLPVVEPGLCQRLAKSLRAAS